MLSVFRTNMQAQIMTLPGAPAAVPAASPAHEKQCQKEFIKPYAWFAFIKYWQLKSQ